MNVVGIRVLVAILPPRGLPDGVLDLLPAAEREQAQGFGFGPRRAHFVAARLLARRALGLVGERAAAVGVVQDSTGRPAFTPPYQRQRLTISHSGSVVMVACGGSRLGVDVEQVRDIGCAVALARHVLAPEAAQAVAEADPRDRSRAFLTAWVRIEAVAKASGVALPEMFGRRTDGHWYLHTVPVADGYVAALATESAAHMNLDHVDVC